jgi:hypothetical protein
MLTGEVEVGSILPLPSSAIAKLDPHAREEMRTNQDWGICGDLLACLLVHA